MRICLYSNVYAPSRGGIQSVSASLAAAWKQMGHDVLLVTDADAPAGFDDASPFPVLRHPSPDDWKRIAKDYDALVCNGFSLRYLKTWKLRGIKFCWIHQMYIAWDNPTGVSRLTWLKWKLRRRLRPMLAHLAPLGNIFISEAVKKDLNSADGPVIFNPIAGHFRPLPGTPKRADVGFFGRMWLAKGQDTLLEALQICHAAGNKFTADFYGIGEDMPRINELVAASGLGDAVRFHQPVHGEELVQAMNACDVIAVPSKWAEPMGVVAVEAMACGKCTIGTNLGGLGEVLAGYQPTFDNGNAPQLAAYLTDVLLHPEKRAAYEQRAIDRAKDFTAERVAQQYLDFLAKQLGHQ